MSRAGSWHRCRRSRTPSTPPPTYRVERIGVYDRRSDTRGPRVGRTESRWNRHRQCFKSRRSPESVSPIECNYKSRHSIYETIIDGPFGRTRNRCKSVPRRGKEGVYEEYVPES